MHITEIKKLISILLMALLLAGSIFSIGNAVSQEEKDAADQAAKDAASASEDADAKKKEAQDAAKKRAAVVGNVEDAEKKLNEIQSEIEATESQIASITASIDYTLAEIGDTQKEIREKEEEIEAQNDALGNRLAAMYKAGSAGIMDVVLNSESVESLLTNWGMVHRIFESDQKLLENLQKDYEELEEVKAELQEQQEYLENQEIALEEQQLRLEGQKAETDELKKKYQEEADRLHAMQKEKEAEAAQMAAEAAAKQAAAEAMLAEIERKEKEEEEERKRKEEEERRRKEEEERKKKQEQEGQTNQDDQKGQQDEPTAAVSTGTYAWPLDSNWEQSDGYGWRICPFHGREFHNGLDLVLTKGTNGAPVYAIANGVVTKASWYGGYGNCVMYAIKGGYTVLCGHLSGFNCSEGDIVKKGQIIGYVGSTGNSTGPHLHFTVFRNGDTIDPYSLY